MGRAASPASVRVEATLARLDPVVTAPLRNYFAEKEVAGRPAPLSPLVSLALVLGSPPEFTLSLPSDHIPPDASPLSDLVPLLQAFYAQARLEDLRNRVLPYYNRAIAERQARVAQQLLEARGYLRLIGESSLGRTYTIYLEWLVPPALVSARNYGENYSLVIHPERADFLDAVRHQYLHFLLDPVAVKYAAEMGPLARLQDVAARAPRLQADFRQDTLLLVTESLVQAIELRLQKLQPAATAARLDEIERSGLIFARHFFYALERFEQEEPSIRFYFPELLTGFDPDEEARRLAKVDFAAPPPAPEPAVASPEAIATRLLAEAESALAAGDSAAARAGFERVLQQMDANHPGALYGLALVASAEQDPETAKLYFERTLAQAREPRILGWTHIYLGRIYDLEGSRQEALEHYRAALALNTHLERIEQAARRGLERPFGESEDVAPQEP